MATAVWPVLTVLTLVVADDTPAVASVMVA